MITIKAVPTQAIFLGRVGENERLRVAFDVGPYLTEYPGASFVLLNQGPEDAQPYPCAEVALDGTTLYWVITSADVHAEGRGRCELIVTVDDVTAKSIIFDTRIMRSLTGTGAVPPDWGAWLETFAEYKADAETAATEAEAASEAIQDMSVVASTRDPGTGATVGKFVDPITGAVRLYFGIPQGAPGVSPEIYVLNIEGGHRVIIIRADGTSLTFDVMDGANGADGATGPQGEPGFSPTVQVTDITGGHQVAITDQDGTHTFDVMDGEVTQEEFDELKSAVEKSPEVVESDAENVDLDVSDTDGNVILRLQDGHLLTKYFNSKNQPVSSSGSNATADLDISDVNGNVVLRLKDGEIYVRHFYSGYIRQLTGKKWTVIGDSLTEHNQRASKNYHDYIADETGISVVNLGHSGRGYAKVASGLNFAGVVPSIPADTDVITIFGSGNDKSSELDLGDITDDDNTTICGCINLTFDALFDAYPLIPLGVITPTPWINSEPSDGVTAMSQYCEKLVQICARRGIPCLDLYHCSNLHPDDVSFRELAYSKDDGNGVHPDEVGQAIIAPRFRQFLFTLI